MKFILSLIVDFYQWLIVGNGTTKSLVHVRYKYLVIYDNGTLHCSLIKSTGQLLSKEKLINVYSL